MGVVYLAQDEHSGREVALKAIRPENLFFAEARERFRRETELVAGLRHRHIVPILEVGEDRGLPFFVMERVEGVSLAAALAALPDNDLDTTVGCSGRFTGPWTHVCVRVLAEVAEAVGHAHAHGVVHRDVKPANILLARDGHASLTDFGLGRAEGEGSRRLTRGCVGSLDYMAPELLRASPPRQGPRQDVFALGRTLHQMLTIAGRGPLAGDVETVCLTAMDPDPLRRYPTAAEMARDLRAILSLQPIAARRPGPVVRLRRWARRHPTLTVACALGFLLVFVAPLLAWLANRTALAAAERERAAKALVVEFQSALIAEADPARNGGRVLTVLEALELVLPRYEGLMARDPRVASSVLAAAGGVYLQLGRPAEAEAKFARAMALQDAVPDYVPSQLVDLQCSIAQSLAMAHRFDAAQAAIERAESLARAKCGDRSPELGITLVAKGQILASLYLWRPAMETFGSAMDVLAVYPDLVETRLQAQIGLASACRWCHCRLREAHHLLDVALEAAVRRHGRHSACEQSATRELASLELVLGDWDAAARLGSRALELARKLYRHDDHPQVALACNDLGLILRDTNRPTEAEPLLRACLVAHQRLAAGGSEILIDKQINLAMVLGALGRFDEAEQLLQDALALARTAIKPQPSNPHHLVHGCQEQLARLYFAAGRLDRAEPLLRESVARFRGSDSFGLSLGWHLGLLADIERQRGRTSEAEALYRQSIDALFPGVGDDVRYRRLGGGVSIFERTLESLRALLRARGDDEGIQALDRECERRLRAHLEKREGQQPLVETAFLLRLLGTTLVQLGRPAEARPVLERALGMVESEAGPHHCEAREARVWLAKSAGRR